ncbi:hypothetical protein [Rufibacter sp. LB8]|uniref:hypothetical protein n=1 Tax=Rufibacter sp. LB8 TaxID=2777781 RepID=UPI00178C22C0|nr:hypothetical protein [Rufibacter sp. LB8]
MKNNFILIAITFLLLAGAGCTGKDDELSASHPILGKWKTTRIAHSIGGQTYEKSIAYPDDVVEFTKDKKILTSRYGVVHSTAFYHIKGDSISIQVMNSGGGDYKIESLTQTTLQLRSSEYARVMDTYYTRL